MLPRAALFDLDGTLLDSIGDIAASMNHSLTQHHLPTHPVEDYLQFVGEGVMMLVRKAIPEGREALHSSVLASYRAHYTEHLFDQTKPFPGIVSVLEQLAAEHVHLAVLSNKADAFTRQLVEGLLPAIPFAAVHGERLGVPRKPDPAAALALAAQLGVAPADCAFVGDTAVDMDTASAAGMYSIGVTWGFRGAQELRAHGARRWPPRRMSCSRRCARCASRGARRGCGLAPCPQPAVRRRRGDDVAHPAQHPSGAYPEAPG